MIIIVFVIDDDNDNDDMIVFSLDCKCLWYDTIRYIFSSYILYKTYCITHTLCLIFCHTYFIMLYTVSQKKRHLFIFVITCQMSSNFANSWQKHTSGNLKQRRVQTLHSPAHLAFYKVHYAVSRQKPIGRKPTFLWECLSHYFFSFVYGDAFPIVNNLLQRMGQIQIDK